MTKRTSINYLTTYDVNSANDMLLLADARKMVSGLNKIIKKDCIAIGGKPYTLRLVVRGRKPFVRKIVTDRWTGRQTLQSYDFGGNIVGGIANATKLDAYIYRRYNR